MEIVVTFNRSSDVASELIDLYRPPWLRRAEVYGSKSIRMEIDEETPVLEVCKWLAKFGYVKWVEF
ncbi:MAG: hypothetical protein QXL34_07245 [Thermosphaera sp.]